MYLDGGCASVLSRGQEECAAPLITIITTTFNVEKILHWTIDSVRAQSYRNIQWIVADGGSTDSTIEIIKKNEGVITYWFSEPDKGIYNAMNKALNYAEGQWVLFLGADDIFCDDKVLQDFANMCMQRDLSGYDIVYGRVSIVNETGAVLYKVNDKWSKMSRKWFTGRPSIPHHQGIFHNMSWIRSKPKFFDEKYKIAADGKVILESILNKSPFYFDRDICRASLGGYSTDIKNRMKLVKEVRCINRELNIKNSKYELFFLIKSLIRIIMYYTKIN